MWRSLTIEVNISSTASSLSKHETSNTRIFVSSNSFLMSSHCSLFFLYPASRVSRIRRVEYATSKGSNNDLLCDKMVSFTISFYLCDAINKSPDLLLSRIYYIFEALDLCSTNYEYVCVELTLILIPGKLEWVHQSYGLLILCYFH